MGAPQDQFLPYADIRTITRKSRSTIWRWERAGIFPRSRKIGPNSVGWVASEIQNWIEYHKDATPVK